MSLHIAADFRSPNLKRVLSGLCASLYLLACASGAPSILHEYTLAPGQAFHPGIGKALLIPLNETERPPAGMEVADHVIFELITKHLESKGLTVESLSAPAFRNALQIASQKAHKQMLSGAGNSASASIEFSDIVPPLLAELGSDAQIVVVTNVALRSGEYVGTKTIKWDGVKRREKVGGGAITGSGLPVASLHSVIFSRDGGQIFSAYGGLDAIFETNIAKAKYELKEDLLQNEKFLAEGVCVSFHPFFGLQEDC